MSWKVYNILSQIWTSLKFKTHIYLETTLNILALLFVAPILKSLIDVNKVNGTVKITHMYKHCQSLLFYFVFLWKQTTYNYDSYNIDRNMYYS